MTPHRPLRILIGSGPTREPIDPVRFISNYSTGYMGARLASEALARGHRVTVVSGPSLEPLPRAARTVSVETAREMEQALRRLSAQADAVIMAAAVSDFRTSRIAAAKLKRTGRRPMTLRLRATPDILARLPRRRHQTVAGFALETTSVLPRAARKLREKRLDLLVAQEANGRGAPFGRHPVRAWLLERTGRAVSLGRRSKAEIARALLDKIEALWYGQRDSKTT